VQILMTEIVTDRARTAVSLLEARGHEIVTCGDGTERLVTCAALRGRPCPLDAHSIDVALHVDRDETPGLQDEGVLCALRRFVPVVVAAADPGSPGEPFGRWATAVCDLDDLGATLAAAAVAPLLAHGAAAEKAANKVLASAGCAETWRAVVRRDGRRLVVELRSEAPVHPELCGRSAVRAEGALRMIDALSHAIDVEIEAPAG
jgi:hypothetical protein